MRVLLSSVLRRRKLGAATKTVSRIAASRYGRSARSKSEPQWFDGRARGVETNFNASKIRRDKQLRRRRRERARRQKNRGANRAVIVVVAWNLRWRLPRTVGRQCLRGKDDVRIAAKPAQMHVAKRERDLKRQRDQRQRCAASFMAMNPAHPRNHPRRARFRDPLSG